MQIIGGGGPPVPPLFLRPWHLHITNIMHFDTSYSTLLNKRFAQVIKINLCVSTLYRYDISDEKKPS